MAEHVVDTDHQIYWSVKVLNQDLNQTCRLVREAICIRRNSPSMNRDHGYELNSAYNKLIMKDGSHNKPSRGGDH